MVDYLDLTNQLKEGVVTYTKSDGKGNPTFDTAQAIVVMLGKHGTDCNIMHGGQRMKFRRLHFTTFLLSSH